MKEIETKVLEVDISETKSKLEKLGAGELSSARLIIDWFSLPGAEEEGHSWYLRVRSDSQGKKEISWKSLPKITGNTRHSDEIQVNVSDTELAKKILLSIGLECYAHQEKDRTTFTLGDWNFDLDKYPGMPAYLEIEGKSHEHVQEAIKLLGLENHRSVGEGERKVIEEEYKLDWKNMRF